jgi:hypothetical protein
MIYTKKNKFVPFVLLWKIATRFRIEEGLFIFRKRKGLI